jgi:succinoglycan biosynthesis transport protein ExoP
MKPQSSKSFPDDDGPAAHSGVGRDRVTGEEDTIELGWYVRAIQRRWLLLAAGTLLAGAAAFWIATLQPLRFEGVTTLLVVPPSQPTSAQISPATFRAIVENASLASEVIRELKLDAGDDPTTPQRFLEDAMRVEEVRGTNIVKVKVTLRDPQQAAEASRRMALKAIALTQQIRQDDGESIQTQLKSHLTDAQQRMQTAERDLLAYKQAAQIELMTEDTDAQLKERGDLLRLVVDIEAERARLAAAEAELARQQPMLSAPRLPGTEQALRQVQSDAKPAVDPLDRKRDLTRGEVSAQYLDLTNPFVNPVYQTLDFQIATTRTRIAALMKERDELVNVKKLGGKALAELSELYRRQVELARLQAGFELASKVYSDLALRYEQSRTQPLGSTAQLQVIDLALPPERPLSRRRLQYLQFGLVAGLGMSVLIAFALERGRRP